VSRKNLPPHRISPESGLREAAELIRFFGVTRLRTAAIRITAAVLVLAALVLIGKRGYALVAREKSAGETEPVQKTVYLTFDDGPSVITEDILAVLEEYRVKATFFVVGPDSYDANCRLLRISMAGHSVGLHSWTHDYSVMYTSMEGWKRDIETEKIWIESVTGKCPKIIRLPGGVANSTATPALMKQILAEIEAEGLTLCAWNVDSTDGINQCISAYEIARKVLTGARGKDTVVVLFHDYETRSATAAALPALIEAFRSRGYEFRTFR